MIYVKTYAPMRIPDFFCELETFVFNLPPHSSAINCFYDISLILTHIGDVRKSLIRYYSTLYVDDSFIALYPRKVSP